MSTTRIIDFFDGLTDFRHPYRNKRHELIDIVAISICAVICGADSWEEIEAYAKIKKDWLT
nr:transposase family protein [Crocinitomicaceae bacterium]